MNQPPEPAPPDSPPDFRPRLRWLTLALMGAQVGYILVGWLVVHHAGRASTPDAPVISACALVLGLLLIAFSFLIVGVLRPASPGTRPGNFQLTQQFFLGFAVAESGATIGLVVCLIFHVWPVLVILATSAAVAIYGHYRRVARRMDEANPTPSSPP